MDRLGSFLEEARITHGDGENLVVGHGTALRLLLQHLGVNEKLTRKNFVRVEL
jgi:broad specificity phosphatase PhoE